MRLTGNTILITGATSGIGLGFAKEFVSGNTVIICGRRIERLNEIKKAFPKIITINCDISDEKQREKLAEMVIKNYPSMNVLINNAGIQLGADLTHPIDVGKVRMEVETNFIAPIHLASLFTQHLMSEKDSAIINISSGLGFVPIAFMPIYCATKAAIHSATLSLRHQLKSTQVKVFEIAPPSVDTELGHAKREDKSKTHGGMSVKDFVSESMKVLENDVFETGIGSSAHLVYSVDEMFERMNH